MKRNAFYSFIILGILLIISAVYYNMQRSKIPVGFARSEKINHDMLQNKPILHKDSSQDSLVLDDYEKKNKHLKDISKSKINISSEKLSKKKIYFQRQIEKKQAVALDSVKILDTNIVFISQWGDSEKAKQLKERKKYYLEEIQNEQMILRDSIQMLDSILYSIQNESTQIPAKDTFIKTKDSLANVKKEIENKFEEANQLIIEYGHKANIWKKYADFFSWVSFGLGAVITILTGFLGLNSKETETKEKNSPLKNNTRLTIIVGIIAATSSISSGISTKTLDRSDLFQKKIIEINEYLQYAEKKITIAGANELNGMRRNFNTQLAIWHEI